MGKKVIAGYYGNRIVPGKLADNEVIVVSFIDEKGVPVGIVHLTDLLRQGVV